jgi:hypothetical protein
MIQPCGMRSKISRCCGDDRDESSLARLTALPISTGRAVHVLQCRRDLPADRSGGSIRVLRFELRVGRLIEVIAGGHAMWVAIADRPHEVL